MPEVHPCQQCRKAVDIREAGKQRYVIPNKATARSREQWVYSHYRCWVSSASPAAPMDVRELLRNILLDAGDETFRLLGLQRSPVKSEPDEPGGGAHGQAR